MTGDLRQDRPTQFAVALLKPSILAHLLGRSAYGYELRGQLLAIGLECDLGTVYRALNTMEDEGLLRSTWERSRSGRSRRRYELNPAGVAMVEAYVEAVEQLVGVANAFIEMRRRGEATGACIDLTGSCETLRVTRAMRSAPDHRRPLPAPARVGAARPA
ncbi:MAG TPA: helix-turn-helix transcriptional regulator [Candidatus Dormibacteraeota bacterium]